MGEVQNEGKQTNSSHTKGQTFFLPKQVINRKDALLKLKLQTLIKAKGLYEKDFYHSIGISKQNWYSYSWGLIPTPQEWKIRIAQALGTDSSVIWQEKEK